MQRIVAGEDYFIVFVVGLGRVVSEREKGGIGIGLENGCGWRREAKVMYCMWCNVM